MKMAMILRPIDHGDSKCKEFVVVIVAVRMCSSAGRLDLGGNNYFDESDLYFSTAVEIERRIKSSCS